MILAALSSGAITGIAATLVILFVLFAYLGWTEDQDDFEREHSYRERL